MLLGFSGLMAFVVAFVPTVPDGRCGPNAYSQTPAEIAAAVRNNIWSLVVVAALAAGVTAWLKRGTVTRDSSERPTVRSVVVTVVCGAILLGELVLFLALRDRFIALSHDIAAGTMVAGVIAVMVLSALRAEDRHRGAGAGTVYKRIYIAIAVALAAALGTTVLAALTVHGFDHLVLIAEVIVIVLFATYWGVQTKELWDLRAADGLEARPTQGVVE
ncbi:hypothetical protein [Terrabacter carboxydivorans]|uniref:DUF998 domain-containing protein n=1 Tax=Terrabacter carboxydivorans TaxID=619730 RepID=A0ABP5YDN8_9MICO